MASLHQNLLNRCILEIQKKYPSAHMIPRITGFYYTIQGTGIRVGREGEADLEIQMPICDVCLAVIYCEIKIGKDTQKDKQKRFQANIEKRYGLYVITRQPSDILEAIEKYLQGIYKRILF